MISGNIKAIHLSDVDGEHHVSKIYKVYFRNTKQRNNKEHLEIQLCTIDDQPYPGMSGEIAKNIEKVMQGIMFVLSEKNLDLENV